MVIGEGEVRGEGEGSVQNVSILYKNYDLFF